MDFSLTEEQQALRELARRLFDDGVSHERLRELEAGDAWMDRALWSALSTAGIPALALPEALGGSDFGMLEICLVLEELGRAVAPVPLHPTLVLGALPIQAFGSEAQRRRWLLPVAHEAAVLSAALHEVAGADPARPRTLARRDGTGWRLHGEKQCVPAAGIASVLLVPARTGADSVGVFLLEPDAPGVSIERQQTTHREPQGRLVLDGARVGSEGVLGDPEGGARIVAWTLERARVGLCAIQLGAAEEALRRTAEYTSSRRQFGRPIASFQGVALRAADAYVDVECMRATLLQAAWRLAEELPASAEVAAASWWAARGGQRVAHTAQHLHGGIGSDVDYPIHRYFLWSLALDVALGGAGRQLAELGAHLVEERRPED